MAKYLTNEPGNYEALRSRLRPSDDNNVEKIVFACALPSESEVIRYNGDASGIPTSAKTLMQDVKLNWDNSTVDKAIPAAEMMVFLFRNALRSFVYYDHNEANLPFEYRIYEPGGGYEFDYGGQVGGDMLFLDGSYAKPITPYQPHGEFLFPANCNGYPGYWCDADGRANRTTGLSVTFDADPGAAGATIQWCYWTGTQWQGLLTTDTAAGVLTYQNSGPYPGGQYGTIRIRINNIAAAKFRVSLKTLFANSPGIWCQRSIPNMSELLPIIQGLRVNAASVLWTNFSPDLYESGKIVSVTVSRCLPWSNIAISQSNLTKLQGYESRQAKSGYYGFLKPDGPNDFMLTADITTDARRGTNAQYGWFNPMERSTYIAVAYNVASTQGRDTSIQVTHSIEYLTNSKIQEVAFSQYTEEEWVQAIQQLREIPEHHENKFHFKKLLRRIGRIGKKIFKVAKTITGAIPLPMFQVVNRGLQMAEDMGAVQGLDALSNVGRKRTQETEQGSTD